MREKQCKICSNRFYAKTNEVCCSEDCRSVRKKRKYSATITPKNCKYCLNVFSGTTKQIICYNCKKSPRKISFRKIEQVTKCRFCGEEIARVVKNVTRNPKSEKLACCKPCLRASQSDRLKNKNPMKNPKVVLKILKSSRPDFSDEQMEDFINKRDNHRQLTHEQKMNIISDRMTTDNPMFSPLVKAKVSQTRKNSTKEFPKGHNHGLWKGNRCRSQVIRTRLYSSWVKPNLVRANFCCEVCSATKVTLEVHHHSVSFADSLMGILNGRILKELSDDEFEIVILDMIENHRQIVGMVVCVPCHKTIDAKRR